MARQICAWNKYRTKSVVLPKLKEFSIDEVSAFVPMYPDKIVYQARGWFNKENFFLFGEFETKAEAEMFLESIHQMYNN